MSISYPDLWKFTFNGDNLKAVGYRFFLSDSGEYVTDTYVTAPVDFRNGEQITISHQGNDGIFLNGLDYQYNIICFQSIADILVVKGHVVTADENSVTVQKINALENPFYYDFGNGSEFVGGQYICIGTEKRLITDIIQQDDTLKLSLESSFSAIPADNTCFSVLSNYEVSPNYFFRARTNPQISVSALFSNGKTELKGTYSQAQNIYIKSHSWEISKDSEVVLKTDDFLSSRLEYSCFLPAGSYTVTLNITTSGNSSFSCSATVIVPSSPCSATYQITDSLLNGCPMLTASSNVLVFRNNIFIGSGMSVQDTFAPLSVPLNYTICPFDENGIGEAQKINHIFNPYYWYIFALDDNLSILDTVHAEIDISCSELSYISNNSFTLSFMCCYIDTDDFNVNTSHSVRSRLEKFFSDYSYFVFKSPDGKVFTADIADISFTADTSPDISNKINLTLEYLSKFKGGDFYS